MDDIFILKPYATALELKDAIDERLIKAKAITGCLLSQDYDLHESNHAIFNGAVWAIEDYLDEIELMNGKLQKTDHLAEES
ncbi:MAG: hypothetical protein PVG30_05610 [Gammaproteobacteria bacterium]|jgi:hypothetical protein